MTTLQTDERSVPPATSGPAYRTVAALLEHLGGLPPERVWLQPAPGTATEQDVLDIEAHEGRLCELVDGVLVEKAMGIEESLLAAELIFHIKLYLKTHKVGIVAAPDGTIRLLPSQVRMPDVAYFSWDRLPNGRAPNVPIPAIYPDLAIEVLSASNTKREMSRKLREYFTAGTRLAWYVDPALRAVAVYTSVADPIILHSNDVLDGGAVLPGFVLPVGELFAVLDERRGG